MKDLEFVNIMNKDIFDLEVPDYDMIKDVDMFVTNNSTIVDCNLTLQDKVVEWLKDGDKMEMLKDIETFKQIPYGCIDCTYKTSLKTSIQDKEYKLVTNAFKKFKFGKNFLTSNRSKTFFGLDGDFIIFNNYFYNDKNEEELTPYFVAKLDISRLRFEETDDFAKLSINLGDIKDLEFLAISKEGYKCMNTFEVVMMNSRRAGKVDNGFIEYLHHQLQGIVTMYLYFMINLLYYNHCKETKKVSESATKEDASKNSSKVSSGVVKTKENRKRYVYFGDSEYIFYDKDNTRIGSKGWHIKHSFPVKETSYYNKYGTLVKRKAYMKGVKQGLPPLKSQKIYIDDSKKGGSNNGS